MLLKKARILIQNHTSIISNTLVYTLSSAFNALVGFVLLPILTRYLKPNEYGLVETFSTVSFVITGVVLFGGNTLLPKEYFRLTSDERRVFLADNSLIVFVSGGVLAVLIWVGGPLTRAIDTYTKLGALLLELCVAVGVSRAMVSLALTLFQIQSRPLAFSLFSNSQTVFDIALSIILVVLLKWGWVGRITSIVGSSVLFMIVGLWVMDVWRRPWKAIEHIRASSYRRMIIISGLPLILSHVSGWLLDAANKVIIANLISLSATGIYSVAAKFGMVIMMIETAFSRAWLPFFFEKLTSGTNANRRTLVMITYLYIVVLFFVAVAYGIFMKFLLKIIVGPEYYEAGKFILLIGLSYWLDGVWKMFIGYLVYAAKIKTYSAIIIVSGIINVILNYALLPRMGIMGAAVAMFASYLFGSAATIYFSTRSVSMPWNMAVVVR